MTSNDYLNALDRLCQPVRVRDYPTTLQPMRDLLAAIGNPHHNLCAVVVAGSTGKGTACHRLTHSLRANGFKVGLYTSPHLHSFRERFSINGQMIDADSFVTGATLVAQAAAGFDHMYSTFEQATALALWWFGQQQPDVVVLEIGLGGRWDAVNVVENLLAVFTPIEAEHTAMLGGSLESVAGHKAGIIQSSGQAITVRQSASVAEILRSECEAKGAQLQVIDDDTLAQAAYSNLTERGIITPETPAQEIEFAPLPGRLESIRVGGRAILIDGGHTPRSAQYLLDEINRLADATDSVRLIVGLLNDKNARAYLQVFDSPRFHITLTHAPGHRAATPATIAAQAQLEQASVEVVSDVNTALQQAHNAPEALVVVAGSLRMAALARETYGLLTDDERAEARATRAIFEGKDYLAKLSTGGKAPPADSETPAK